MDFKFGSFDVSRLRIGSLYNVYLGMTSREQTIALVAAGVVLLLAVVLPVTVASNKIGQLENEIAKGNRQIREVVREIDRYQEIRAQLVSNEAKLAGGFDSAIATTMESLASQAGIADRIDSLKEKPTAASDMLDEVSVDVRLTKVALPDLIKYLQSIEQNPDRLLRLKQLEIKPRYDSKKELNASFTVSTFRLLETTGGGE